MEYLKKLINIKKVYIEDIKRKFSIQPIKCRREEIEE